MTMCSSICESPLTSTTRVVPSHTGCAQAGPVTTPATAGHPARQVGHIEQVLQVVIEKCGEWLISDADSLTSKTSSDTLACGG
jgi:hypothetical protein